MSEPITELLERIAQGDLIDLHEALERLNEISSRQAQLVELRFFGGLSQEEAGELLSVSRRTVATDWAMAKAWLHRELQSEKRGESS